jgi:hypothetical protein
VKEASVSKEKILARPYVNRYTIIFLRRTKCPRRSFSLR